MREANFYADFMAKEGPSITDLMVVLEGPPMALHDLLRKDHMGTAFIRS